MGGLTTSARNRGPSGATAPPDRGASHGVTIAPPEPEVSTTDGEEPGSGDPFDPTDGFLVIAADDARLLVHLLATFERLLRHGNLSDRQLELLTPDRTGPTHAADDLMLAQVVGEALDDLRRQLDET